MRILQLLDSLNPLDGGVAECVRQISAEMEGMGHEVHIALSSDKSTAPWLLGSKNVIHALGPSSAGRFAYSARFRRWLVENASAYDRIVINGLWQYPGYCGARVARRLGIPYYLYPHGTLDPWSRRASPLKYLKKLTYWLLAERSTLGNAAAVVFTSEDESRLAPTYFGYSNWRSIVVGHGVPEPPIVGQDVVDSLFAKYSIARDRPRWLFLSRVHPKKGLEDLLAAMRDIPRSTGARPLLVLAGGGDRQYVDTLRKQATASGLDQDIVWTGPLFGSEKWAAFNSAELFVLPSHQENFGIVIAEALSVGLPVCTTRQVNIWREVDSCQAGLVCSDNAKDLQSMLQKWILLSEPEKRAFGDRARQCFEKHFQIRTAAARLAAAMTQAAAT